MKGRSIAEAVLVFIILQAIIIVPKGMRNLIRWENSSLGGSYITGFLLIALPLFMIILKQYEFKSMGLTLDGWKISLGYGLRGYLFFILPQIVLSILFFWGLNYRDSMVTAIVLSLLVFIMTFLMNRLEDIQEIGRVRLIFIMVLLALPFTLSFVTDRFTTRLLFKFIWNILVGGFAEEFFYRGFVQSSINLEFERNWRMGKTNYGPGLLVSSLLYGLSRGMRTFRLWSESYVISWSWSVFVFSVGIFYGFIRERAGNVLGSGSGNALIDGLSEAFLGSFS